MHGADGQLRADLHKPRGTPFVRLQGRIQAQQQQLHLRWCEVHFVLKNSYRPCTFMVLYDCLISFSLQ